MRIIRLLLVALIGLGAAPADPGILIEIEDFELRARDLSDRAQGPRVPVTLGTPSRETPRGRFRPLGVIRNPAWVPGARARRFGAEPMPPSGESPMGVAKIPFADRGAIALHGAGDPILLGKPASSGCVRMADDAMVDLLDWMAARGVLGRQRITPEGEIRQGFRRPVRISIR